MKQLIKQIFKESLKFILIENMMMDEDYPTSFDMTHFKKLSKFAERVRYCEEHLKKISSGSSRIVYMIDNIKVLKLAKNKKGLAQNEIEAGYSKYSDLSDVVAQTFDYNENNLWVEMELARAVRKPDFKRITGYSFEDYCAAIHNYGNDVNYSKHNHNITIDKDIIASMWENEFVYGIFEYIGNYGIPVGDLKRLSSYGIVKRNGQDTIVLIDFGLTNDVYDSYYK